MKTRSMLFIIVIVLILIFLILGTWIPHENSRSSSQFLGCIGVTICYDANLKPVALELLKSENLSEIHYGADGIDFTLIGNTWRAIFVKRSIIIDGPGFTQGLEYNKYNTISGNLYWHIQNYTFFNIPFGRIKKVLVNHA